MSEMYTSGDYLAKNPTWHEEDSPWKADQVMRMIKAHDLKPGTVCEVGCGAGGVLSSLQKLLDPDCILEGYDISPQAYELARAKANERLRFHLGDFLLEKDKYFDLMLIIDLIEHLEDYFSFLREIRKHARSTILHIPIDMSAQSVLRSSVLVANRRNMGHIHYFNKALALEVLRETGFEVVDCFYTRWSLELPVRGLKVRLAFLPRKIAAAVNQELAVRMFGGFSLMVLAR